MAFVDPVLRKLGVTSTICCVGMNTDPQTEDELYECYKFEQPTPPITWESYWNMRKQIMHQHGLMHIRNYRNKELVQTDWVETPYNQSTIANLDEWLTYRQTLRDLPNTITEFIWKLDGLPALDLTSMNIPIRPRVIRRPT